MRLQLIRNRFKEMCVAFISIYCSVLNSRQREEQIRMQLTRDLAEAGAKPKAGHMERNEGRPLTWGCGQLKS